MSVVARVRLKVHFLDGSTKTVIVAPTASALEVCEAVASKLELQPAGIWALFERSKKRSRRLADTDLPYHVMQRWKEGSDMYFLMKYKLIFKEDNIPREPFAVHMLFIQIKEDVIHGSLIPTFHDSITLAALQLVALLGGYTPERCDFLKGKLDRFLPPSVLAAHTHSDLEDQILLLYAQFGVEDATIAMTRYLEIARKYDLFGCTLFLAQEYLPGDKMGEIVVKHARIYIALHSVGIHLVSFPDKQVMESYFYADIVTWSFNKSEFQFTVAQGRWSGDELKKMFGTLQSSEIVTLLQSYVQAFVQRKQARQELELKRQDSKEYL